MTRVAIVGGGPGGLFTSYLLGRKIPKECEITLFEASDRLGGKIRTERFGARGPLYEAGVAELYGYSLIGPDPLHNLVRRLQLPTVPMRGGTVLMHNHVLRNQTDVRRQIGDGAASAIDAFRAEARSLMTPEQYYEGFHGADNDHPWSRRSCRSVLDSVRDPDARRYLEVAAHSDIATEPHNTNALNGLKNFLMDVPGYISLYSLRGGLERLVDRLKLMMEADVRLGNRALRVERSPKGYRVITRTEGAEVESDEYDFVIVALPHPAISLLEWGGERLRRAMTSHIAHYDHDAHYLRVSILFSRPFWREVVRGHYFVQDSWGGTCLYDEGARYGDAGKRAVLGWLIAGGAALELANWSDEALIAEVLATLPAPLRKGRDLAVEGRVHRWLAAVSAQPGGYPALDPVKRHAPEPRQHPGLFVVGDYLFDSTLNGVLDSADVVSDLVLSEVRRRLYAPELRTAAHTNGKKKNGTKKTMTKPDRDEKAALAGSPNDQTGNVSRAYHDFYDGEHTYEESFEEYFDAEYNAELVDIVWGRKPPYTLLDCGSASGLTLAEFDRLGIEATGIEYSAYMQGKTPEKWKSRNILGDVAEMPFANDQFDFLYDTSLCYVPPERVEKAIAEMARVCKTGIFFGAITADMTPEVIEAHDLFYGVSTLATLWQWSEKFQRNGWRLAVTDQKILDRAWKCECAANEGDYPWYPSKETMRYCFYTKIAP